MAAVLLALIIMLAAYIVFITLRSGNEQPDATVIELLFFNTATLDDAIEERTILGNTESALLNAAFEEWLLGPSYPALTNFLPQNAIVSVQHMPDGYALVVFSEHINELPALEINLCHASLVLSLTSLPFITDVVIYVNETYVRTANRGNTHLVEDTIPPPYESIVIFLYFANAMGTHLAREGRIIYRNPNRPIEQYVIEQLIAGPGNEAHSPTISPHVTLISIYTDDNNISYVNLCAEFRSDGSAAELFMIYSIVNSLTALPHIDKVQFLINHDLIRDDMGFHQSLTSPIERDTSLIR